MDFILSTEELAHIYGLPHIQQLAYLRGIRPYMDVKTSMVGIKRRISYQSIAEQLYVEPHQGIQSGSPSRDQLRRAVKGLERARLIEIQSDEKHLILKCLSASTGYFVQNKAATNPPSYPAIDKQVESYDKSTNYDDTLEKADIGKTAKAATPLEDKNYIYLLSQFEKFWSLYPEKKSKNSAWLVFQQFNFDNALINKLMQALQAQIQHHNAQQAHGKWVPPWKYPSNWLAQRCWEDEINMDKTLEKTHATHKKNTGNEPVKDLFWDDLELADEPQPNNVIQFQRR